ncbi:MAG: GNAT family N-acetyltransferase [Candidatus Campbellbacteria bacterium]|nr:GNAT family N-acetyltransferase [Candidatus Campbellbacteria bacterium]
MQFSTPEEIQQKQLKRRPAEEQDYEFARQVHHASYRDVVEKQFGSWDEQKQDKFFRSAWESSPHELIYCNGEPCGYFSMHETDDAIQLHELVLLPEFQGQGIGSEILKESLEQVRAKHKPVRLQVLKKNKAANLYRRMGFKETGETETHIEMEFNPHNSTHHG